MPGEIGAQLRHAQMAGAGIILILALAILGFVWLSICAVAELTLYIGEAGAQAAMGAACLIPLLLFAISSRSKAKAHAKAEAEHAAAHAHPELAQISHIAQGLVEKSPFTALAIAALAGVLAARFPMALALLLQVLSPRPAST